MISHPPTELETLIAYRFRDRDLLQRALIHPSHRHEQADLEHDNQRLEFLGDAVLNLVTAQALFIGGPELDEGVMTRLRSVLTCSETLAELGRELDLGRRLHLGRGEEQSGGRQRETNLCDAVEALVGALYLDGGWPAALAFGERFLAPRLRRLLAEGAAGVNPKGALQEYMQQTARGNPVYRLETVTGPAHAPLFEVSVLVGECVLARGTGSSKRQAETVAAAAAWENRTLPSG